VGPSDGRPVNSLVNALRAMTMGLTTMSLSAESATARLSLSMERTFGDPDSRRNSPALVSVTLSGRVRHGEMPMRRVVVIVLLALAALALFATPASAFCSVMPLNEAVHRADAVWWGTVTDAAASARGAPGVWTLTVHLDDVLKGNETPGETARFFQWSCGGFMSPEAAKRAASQFVGQQRLFIGSYARGGLNPIADYFKPQVPAPEQYQLALKDLGLQQRESASPLAPFVSGGLPGWLWLVALAVVALVLVALVVFARRRTQST
jgi:hypothetical protein